MNSKALPTAPERRGLSRRIYRIHSWLYVHGRSSVLHTLISETLGWNNGRSLAALCGTPASQIASPPWFTAQPQPQASMNFDVFAAKRKLFQKFPAVVGL